MHYSRLMKWKPLESIRELKQGDIVRHRCRDISGTYLITAQYGNRATAVATFDITNPPEWEVEIKETGQ